MLKGAVSNIANRHCEAIFAEACLASLCKAGNLSFLAKK
jgi:hypothetical protein